MPPVASLGTASEDEFWGDQSNDTAWWTKAIEEDNRKARSSYQAQAVGKQPISHSRSRSTRRTGKSKSADDPDQNDSSTESSCEHEATPRHGKNQMPSPTAVEREPETRHPSNGSDTEEEEVEHIINMDMDVSTPTTSFTFSSSGIGSRLTSITSFDLTTPSTRKRGYNDHLESPSSTMGTSPVSGLRKKTAVLNITTPTHSKSRIDRWVAEIQASARTKQCSIIAHSGDVQKMMDLENISWGVQYEIARGVCHGDWQWEHVTESRLKKLRGNNKLAAPRVAEVILGASGAKRLTLGDEALWSELDREEKAILEGGDRGLGVCGEWEGDANWYGGKIRQIARLVETGSGQYVLRLEKMLKRKSHRFARFLGSRRVLQVRVPDKLTHGPGAVRVSQFMFNKFVLCGRVFVPFGAKGGKVFMMETDEDYERTGSHVGDPSRMSLEDFVEWHNPMGFNGKQPKKKWVTRFDLGLSDSVPVIQFKGVGMDMFYIDDEFAPHQGDEATTEQIYTDGCGFMNWAALAAIGRALKYSETPTAVQGRIAGAKGLWTLHPEDRSSLAAPRIWIRSSQSKIKYDDSSLPRSHLIFDLVAPPRVSIPSRLSKLTIMVLSHNGVPDRVFEELMKEGLEREIAALTQFDRQLLLWAAVNDVGRVFSGKLRRLAAGSARLYGLGREISDEHEADADSDGADDDTPDQSERDEYSGEPVRVHERVLELLQAGFSPLENRLLNSRIREVVTYRIADMLKEYHITIPKSAEAFIIPDPLHVLKPREIHFRATQNLTDPLDSPSPNIITGDVLIYRNPARLPSDIQKVTAIAHPLLADYVNVIVLPVTGQCSLASLLAGGDYDGDTCVCIYDPVLVESFKGSPVARQPDDFLATNFESQKNIERIADVFQDIALLPDSERQARLQEHLLVGLVGPAVGLYSVFHENAAYAYGLADSRTLRNAFMFNTVLDSRKSGLEVQPDVFKRDKRDLDRKQPECMSPGSEDSKDRLSSKQQPLRRNPRLPSFVLDHLLKTAKKLRDHYLAAYDKAASKRLKDLRDAALLGPYENARDIARRTAQDGYVKFAEELSRLENHVEKHVKHWYGVCDSRDKRRSPTKTPSRTHLCEGAPQSFKELAKSFAQGPAETSLFTFTDVRAVKASCAYYKNPKFAFSVAFGDLCIIKARATTSVAFTREFAETMTMTSSVVRILSQSSYD